MSLTGTIVSGLLLGCAISLVQTAEQTIAGASWSAIVTFLKTVSLNSCLFGVCWAFLARAVQPKLSLPKIIGVSLLGILVLTVLGALLDRALPQAFSQSVLGTDARISHLLWSNGFYGGLYMAGFISVRRAMRSREVLVRVRTARDQSVAVLEEARLEAFRRQLQPQTMLDALVALRLIYREDPAKADDLLDLLVGFLRPAVRSLSAKVTTLAAELDLASRYLQLRALMNGEVYTPVNATVQLPPDVAFPPGLLMPVIEQLNAARGKITLHTTWKGEEYIATLSGRGIAPNALSERLKRRAEAIIGPANVQISGKIIEDEDCFTWILRVLPRRNSALPLNNGAIA
jgi:hypothetical protein